MHRRIADHAPCHRLFWTAILVLCLTPLAYAFDDKLTHPDLTSAAIDLSKLDATLNSAFSMSDGVNSELPRFDGAPSLEARKAPMKSPITRMNCQSTMGLCTC